VAAFVVLKGKGGGPEGAKNVLNAIGRDKALTYFSGGERKASSLSFLEMMVGSRDCSTPPFFNRKKKRGEGKGAILPWLRDDFYGRKGERACCRARSQ